MSDHDPQALRRELLLKAAITAQLDDLVRMANLTAALLERHPKMEENQLRNLLNVAVSSHSIEVTVNFIRYQIARSESAWGRGSEDFGHRVINELCDAKHQLADKEKNLVTIHHLAGKAVALVITAEPGLDKTALFQEVRLRLAQLYLGYLNRAFVFGKKTGEFSKLTKICEQVMKEVANG